MWIEVSNSKYLNNSARTSTSTGGMTEMLVTDWCETAARSGPSKTGKSSLDATFVGVLIAKLTRYIG
jgi:hypothetical protein